MNFQASPVQNIRHHFERKKKKTPKKRKGLNSDIMFIGIRLISHAFQVITYKKALF